MIFHYRWNELEPNHLDIGTFLSPHHWVAFSPSLGFHDQFKFKFKFKYYWVLMKRKSKQDEGRQAKGVKHNLTSNRTNITWPGLYSPHCFCFCWIFFVFYNFFSHKTVIQIWRLLLYTCRTFCHDPLTWNRCFQD